MSCYEKQNAQGAATLPCSEEIPIRAPYKLRLSVDFLLSQTLLHCSTDLSCLTSQLVNACCLLNTIYSCVSQLLIISRAEVSGKLNPFCDFPSLQRPLPCPKWPYFQSPFFVKWYHLQMWNSTKASLTAVLMKELCDILQFVGMLSHMGHASACDCWPWQFYSPSSSFWHCWIRFWGLKVCQKGDLAGGRDNLLSERSVSGCAKWPQVVNADRCTVSSFRCH